MKSVAGKVAFVTGGASGMGLAMARSFAAAGMKVVIADIEQGALDKVNAEFRASNAKALTLKVDVTSRDAMEAAAKETERAFGKVHVVCNNAGVAVGGTVDDMTYRDWDWVMGVNLAGVVNGVQTFVNRIKSHGEGGHIVNTASMAGHIGIPGLGVYNTTKYAVVGMSEVMKLDLAAHHIGVSVLCPGVVNTNIFASGRNRPAELTRADDKDTASLVLQTNVPDADRQAQMSELVKGALDPAVVGDMVLNAILNEEFWIFTHPELKTAVEARGADIAAAFDRWAKYRSEHGV